MKILFDIYHLAEFNWIKHTILNCHYEYDITCVNRGPLTKVIAKEINGTEPIVFGDYKYNKNFFSLLAFVIIPRMFKLFFFIRKNKYNLIVSTSYQAPIIAKLLGIKSVLINDDPTRIHFRLIHNFTTVFLSPPIVKPGKNTEIFNALIHWSYLSPSVFTPNQNILKEYNLKTKQYIFIREVSTDTTNYVGQKEGLIQQISKLINPNISVVLSLEDKTKKSEYPSHWILLQEPVSDVFSLMYYSKLVISSGDSVAREGATLGVPSLYCGVREMPANNVLIELGMLFKIAPSEIPKYINDIWNDLMPIENQNIFVEKLESKWVDVNKLLLTKMSELM